MDSKVAKNSPLIEGNFTEMKSEEEPISSMLKIMVENHEVIEHTVSLIKKEVPELIPDRGDNSAAGFKDLSNKFEALNKILVDNKVKTLIKSVAGKEVNNMIDSTLNAANSTASPKGKRDAFTDGIKKLQSILDKPDKSSIPKDPAFGLAMSIAGLNPSRYLNRPN